MSVKDKKRQEYAIRIMEALSEVEEDLLERCGNEKGVYGSKAGSRCREFYSRNKTLIRRLTGTWAAVLCLAAVGAAGWAGYWRMRDAGGSTGSGGAKYFNSQENEGNGLETADMNGYAAPEAGNEALEDMRAAELSGTKQESGGAAGGIDTGEQTQNDTDRTCPSNDGGQWKDGLGEEYASEKFTENSGLSEKESGDFLIDTEGCPKLNARNYTEEEVKGLEEFDAYIPEKLPAGYVFESAQSNLDLEEQNLTVSWSRGMDYIMLSLRRTEEDVATVDIDKPETYDQRLYEIPFGETVPGEYREVFDDPVFAWEDLDLEIIRSRMLVFEDRGDTAVPRGNFRVLYPDGMLLGFNGRGTAEEIWEMLGSLGE